MEIASGMNRYFAMRLFRIKYQLKKCAIKFQNTVPLLFLPGWLAPAVASFHPDQTVLVHDPVEVLPHLGLPAAVLVGGIGFQALEGQFFFILKYK